MLRDILTLFTKHLLFYLHNKPLSIARFYVMSWTLYSPDWGWARNVSAHHSLYIPCDLKIYPIFPLLTATPNLRPQGRGWAHIYETFQPFFCSVLTTKFLHFDIHIGTYVRVISIKKSPHFRGGNEGLKLCLSHYHLFLFFCL